MQMAQQISPESWRPKAVEGESLRGGDWSQRGFAERYRQDNRHCAARRGCKGGIFSAFRGSIRTGTWPTPDRGTLRRVWAGTDRAAGLA